MQVDTVVKLCCEGKTFHIIDFEPAIGDVVDIDVDGQHFVYVVTARKWSCRLSRTTMWNVVERTLSCEVVLNHTFVPPRRDS